MIFLDLLGILVGSAVLSVILAPLLQYAFKLTEGQKNSFSDSFKICFYANFVSFLVAYILPIFITHSSLDWMWDGVGSLIGLAAFTYLIARELGDLKRSFLIALLLQGLSFLLALAVALLVLAVGVGTVVVTN